MRYFFVVFILTTLNISPALSAECDLTFADYLEDCQPHSCEFTHEILPIRLSRQVKGFGEKGKCEVYEDMPGNMEMKCSYNISDLETISKKYREVAGAESVNITVHQKGLKASSDIDVDGKRLKYTAKEKKIIKDACNIYLAGRKLPND